MVVGIVIRPLGPEDAAVYRACRIEQLESAPDAFGESVDEAAQLPLDAIAARLAAPPSEGCVMGAFENASIVGTAGWFRQREIKTRHKGRIWGVYVAADHRSRGIGRRLLQAVIDAATATGTIEQLTLSVSANQIPARTLYESLAFEKIGCEPRALKIGDRYVDEDLMALRLR